MKSPDGATQSQWYDSVEVPTYPPPTGEIKTQVCVIGAGIAGLTTAYFLARDGKKVVVVDDGPIGSGQTGRTSAHLASAIDDRFLHIEKDLGKEASRVQYQSHAAAIDAIEKICADEKIDCDFKRLSGY